MSNLRNSTRLIGRLGKDPELRALESGTSVATFSMATSDKYTNAQGEKVETTEWHNCVAWGKLAEIIEKYVKKGDEIAIEGKLTHRSYESQDGKKYITEVVAREMLMLGSKNSDNSTKAHETVPAAEPKNPTASTPAGDISLEEEEDDLPF